MTARPKPPRPPIAKPDHLKDYQREAVYKIQVHLRDQPSTLLAFAVGTGKTHVFLAWLRKMLADTTKRGLIIAHRQELIYQPLARIEKFFPSLRPLVGTVMGEQRDVDARLIVATVQSLNSSNRLNEILSHGNIDYIVTDEAHHGIADGYVHVYDRLFEANPDMKHLGVTATPRRADDVALKEIFESVADKLPLNKAIQMGALVPFSTQGFYVEEVSIAHLAGGGQDWSDKAVGTLMSERAVLDTAVREWKKRADGRPTIAFCATIAQAALMAEWFKDAGVTAEDANYLTPKDERAAILKRFASGETTVIANAMLWTEGVDLPMAEVALMLRPTQSDSLYIQMVGRVLRTHPPDKKTALILDLIPADSRNMILAGDLLSGKPRSQRKVEQKAEDKDVTLPCFGIDRDGQGIDGDPDKVHMRILNYMIVSTLAWTNAGRVSTVGLSDTKTLVVVGPDDEAQERIAKAESFMGTDRWNAASQRELDRISALRVYAVEQYKDPSSGKKGRKSVRALGSYPTWDDTIPKTEDYAAQHQDSTLAKKRQSWRKLFPTDGQLKFAARLGIDGASEMMRGALAQAITHKLATDRLKRDRLL